MAIAHAIVSFIRELRNRPDPRLFPSMRASLLIARIAAAHDRQQPLELDGLVRISGDVICGRSPEIERAEVDRLVRTAAETLTENK